MPNELEEFEDVNNESNTLQPDWSNPPKVSDLKQDYTDAKSSHTTHTANVKRWLDNRNITGSVKRKTENNRSSITPKLIRKQNEWRYPSLTEPFLSTEDIFNTYPSTYLDKNAATQAGLILNYQFNNKIDKVSFLDEYSRTLADEGTVIVRVGWDYEDKEEEVEITELLVDPRTGIESVKVTKENQTVVIKNQPTVEVCDYNNVIVDPTCMGNLDKANFIIYAFETSLSDLKKDGDKYSNLDKIKVTNSSVLGEPDYESKDDSSFTFKDKPRQKFVAYEYWGYWDINKTGIAEPIIATYVDDVFIRLEENPFPDQKLPFVSVQYLVVRKSNYGEPDGELLEDNQQIIGAVTRGMIDILGRSANGQMGTVKGALDIPNKRRFDQGLDYEYNNGFDARSAFYTHIFPPIPDSAKYMLDQQNADAEAMSGVKAFFGGISGDSLGSNVGGIRTATDATAKRELDILRRMALGMTQIGRKIMAMNAEFLSEEEIVRITDEEFVTIQKDDLAGNYDVKLTISTSEADNEKAKELAFMLQTMGNNMDASMSQLILAEIATLRKMPELAKRIENYQPQPDPIAQQKAMLELELLKAQIANEGAKAQENTVDVGYKLAKTDTEKAKTRDIHSTADTKDLKYIKDDSGLTRQEELTDKEIDRQTELDMKAADGILSAEREINSTSPN